MLEARRSDGVAREAGWSLRRAAFDPFREMTDDLRPEEGSEVEGRVKVILLRHEDDTAFVEVPGKPVSFGPKIVATGQLG